MNARAVGVIAGLRTKKVAACACLENYLHVLDTNAPINRMEGNFGQARLEEKNSENVRKALVVLRQHKMAAASMDPLAATATGAGLGAALGGAVSFGNPGMMGRGTLAGGSAGYLVSAVDRIVARRQQRQRMEKPAMTKAANISPEWQAKLRNVVDAIRKHPRMATAGAALGGAIVPGAIGYGLGSALGGVSNIGESDPAAAKRRRARFALMGMGLLGGMGSLNGAANMQRVIRPPRVFSLPSEVKPTVTGPTPV